VVREREKEGGEKKGDWGWRAEKKRKGPYRAFPPWEKGKKKKAIVLFREKRNNDEDSPISYPPRGKGETHFFPSRKKKKESCFMCRFIPITPSKMVEKREQDTYTEERGRGRRFIPFLLT